MMMKYKNDFNIHMLHTINFWEIIVGKITGMNTYILTLLLDKLFYMKTK